MLKAQQRYWRGCSKRIWVPPSFAHGFDVLSEEAEVVNKTTDF
jgi:dTDP-4-dehydrorhamnose 3,5-epimerase-like enzyme